MLKTQQSIKKFIQWCRENKVKSFKNENIQFELSEMAFIPEIDAGLKEINLDDKKTMADIEDMTPSEYQEMLMWSSTR